MTSLGNIEATGLAAMTFVDFGSGDLLYLTGVAENLVGLPARALMPRQNVLSTLFVTGYILVRDALPVRQRTGSTVERSPYSPPIKLLAEEIRENSGGLKDVDGTTATVSQMELLSTTLARFTFTTSNPIQIQPGQAAVLDFTDLLGAQEYSHMASAGAEARLNDDRIRTWTISSAHIDTNNNAIRAVPTTTFQLTMRLKEGGLVTGALFSIANQARSKKPDLLEDSTRLGITARLVGISGSFNLPTPISGGVFQYPKMLWIAGGIGLTPFLSMLAAITSASALSSPADIVMLLATREPDILLALVAQVSGKAPRSDHFKLVLHLFSSQSISTKEIGENITVVRHTHRFGDLSFDTLSIEDLRGRKPYLCGPPTFESSALRLLEGQGIAGNVVREGFEY